tara:strand:- start:353 stop:496 length:144 start_codon:yes stop_codon:yes gene_type:complete
VPSADAIFLFDPADYAIIKATAVDSGSVVFVIEYNRILSGDILNFNW